MRQLILFTVCLIFGTLLVTNASIADVVLTFDQSGIANFTAVSQNYGDRVTATPDLNGNAYDIAGDASLTPNVEVSYDAGNAGVALWVSGYGDLTNVLFAGDFATQLRIDFAADSGFEVGVSGFELGAFGSEITIGGIEVTDGENNVLWSVDSTDITETNSNFFNTSGIFSESLSIVVDLTGLGAAADNVGIDNIQFSQRSTAVPEPTSAFVLLCGLAGVVIKRRRS